MMGWPPEDAQVDDAEAHRAEAGEAKAPEETPPASPTVTAKQCLEVEGPEVTGSSPGAPSPCNRVADGLKAPSIRLWSFQKPHMRSFHLAWISFLVSFMAWFAPASLTDVIGSSLHLTKDQIHVANFASVSTTVLARVILGPLCDRYGPKAIMSSLLLVGSVPVFCMMRVESWQGLVAARAATGLLGGAFVMAQSWATLMFQKQIVGTANALVAGWGNLGGGLVQLLMVEVLAGLLRVGVSEDKAWRLSFLFPGSLLVIAASAVHLLGQDSPKGNYAALRRSGATFLPASTSFREAACELGTYLLALQYAASFGVEVVVLNTAATYFHHEFNISVVQAGQIASLGGITNLFSRVLGGLLSDASNRRWGLHGRLVVHFCLLVCEGVLLLAFSSVSTCGQATALLLCFSIFVQAANGSCFSIVPYVSQEAGSVAGLVGAGGNLGGVIFTLMFLLGRFEPMSQGFRLLGYVALAASLSVLLLYVGHARRPKADGPSCLARERLGYADSSLDVSTWSVVEGVTQELRAAAGALSLWPGKCTGAGLPAV